MRLKLVATLAILSAFCVSLSGCPNPGIDVKVYMSRPDLGGMVRLQENEKVPYDQTQGWFAMTPSDFEALINFCTNPKDDDKTKLFISKYLDYLKRNAYARY